MAEVRQVTEKRARSAPPNARKRKTFAEDPQDETRQREREGEDLRLMARGSVALRQEDKRRLRSEAREAKAGRSEAAEEQSYRSFTPAVLDALIEEAFASALGPQGSQPWHSIAGSQCTELPVEGTGVEDGKDGSPVAGDQLDSQCLQSRIQRTLGSLLDGTSGALRVKDVSSAICDIMVFTEDSKMLCRPRSTAGKLDLFPLPAPGDTNGFADVFSSLRALTYGLNSLTGLCSAHSGRANPTASRVLKRLQGVVDGSGILEEPIPTLNFQEFFETRSVDYSGDEIKLAKDISWESISPSLPDEVGQLDLRDFCEGGVRYYLDHFEDFLLPEGERVIGKAPRVMVRDEHWASLARGLVEKGICEVYKEEDLHHENGTALVNGLFGVSKQEMQGNVEVCRLIMNLKPINRNCRPLMGDTATLPSATCLGSMILDQEEALLTSSEDIKCFFYLFKVPRSWRKFFGFGKAVPGDMLGPTFGDSKGFLVSRVLPMGWLNSVGIAQHVHRVVVRRCMDSVEPPLGGESELRRDRVFFI